MLTVFTGGARSGKSRAAVRLADRAARPTILIATALPLDAEMQGRIDRHRRDRPADWTVVEEPLDPDGAVRRATDERPAGTVLIDCLGLWVTNRLDTPDDTVLGEAARVAGRLAAHEGTTVVVTNEVGDGVVPDNALARRFRDTLGLVNQVFVEHAHHAYLCVAGRALSLRRLEEI